MSRLSITPWENAQRTVDDLYADMERRITAAPCGNCPVELTSAFLKLCLAQSCGKCVPCRVGLDRLSALLDRLLAGSGSREDLAVIHQTAQAIVDSADCAIGFEAAQMVLDGYVAFEDDYLAHVDQGSCTANFKSVPCSSLCPAHVDIPGYISLVGEERYEDAVRLIRRDNPFPSVCGLVCEHPCEHHCRRSIVDAPINIRGVKRFAVEHCGVVPAPFRLKNAYGRVELAEREAGWRKNDFELMELGMTTQEMDQECSRCLRCDHYGHAGFKGGRVTKW